MNPHALIQSYVKNTYYVSTIRRISSVVVSSPPQYFETIVWTLKDGKMDKIKEQYDSGNNEVYAFRQHAEVCENLICLLPDVPDIEETA